jgi:short-subunit dehydrogenase
MREEDMADLFRLNVYGPLYGIQEVLPIMKRQGCGQIVNVTSTLGRCSMPLMAAYCMTKFALEALSESLRIEVKPHGIRVIVVGPGLTRTNFSSSATRTGVEYNNSGGASAERVGRAIVRASRRGTRTVYLNAESKVLLALHSMLPRVYDFGFGIWMKKQLKSPAAPSPT